MGSLKFNRLIIRLKRKGCIRRPFFEIVLMKQKSNRNSTVIEKLGFIDPQFETKYFTINSQRLAFWLNRGAVVHDTVKKHIVKFLV